MQAAKKLKRRPYKECGSPSNNHCTFSTGICETLTCSYNGRFDEYGYSEKNCWYYPCHKILSARERCRRWEYERWRSEYGIYYLAEGI